MVQRKPTPRYDGWTPARRTQFLECLTGKPDVRRACAHAGKSRQSAYSLRRRDPAFAVAWDEALREAHEADRRAFLGKLPDFLLRTLSESSTA